jgi:GTPase KRas protein
VLLEILDTEGTEQFTAMRHLYMKTGEGFVLVYSITSRASFVEISTLYKELLKVRKVDYCPVILVGNHLDRESDRQVSTEEGVALAKLLRCTFWEVFSKESIGVNQAFYDLVREIWRVRSELQDIFRKSKPEIKEQQPPLPRGGLKEFLLRGRRTTLNDKLKQ